MQVPNGQGRLSRRRIVQLATLRAFAPGRHDLSVIFNQSPREWRKFLHWLDVSGLALYFLNHVQDLGLTDILPADVHKRLLCNKRDNRQRIAAMVTETIDVQDAFWQRRLSFALLKGISLVPHSVPSIDLRSQLDIDFLIDAKDLGIAQSILEERGYHLHGQSGRSWEYKDEPTPRTSIKQLYTHTGSRSVELHLANSPASEAQLKRRTSMHFQFKELPVLSPEDLFLGQALHLYKHLTSEGARTSHSLELYWHIVHRHNDQAFWDRVRLRAGNDAKTRFALGFVICLLGRSMRTPLPEALTSWTSDRLPDFAHRWIHRFGTTAVLGRAGGSKLSLILHDELIAYGLQANAQRKRRLVPTCLPPRIEQLRAHETQLQRIGRNLRQLRFIFYRLRFHLIEGLRLEIERIRWKCGGTDLKQTNDNSLTHA